MWSGIQYHLLWEQILYIDIALCRKELVQTTKQTLDPSGPMVTCEPMGRRIHTWRRRCRYTPQYRWSHSKLQPWPCEFPRPRMHQRPEEDLCRCIKRRTNILHAHHCNIYTLWTRWHSDLRYPVIYWYENVYMFCFMVQTHTLKMQWYMKQSLTSVPPIDRRTYNKVLTSNSNCLVNWNVYELEM